MNTCEFYYIRRRDSLPILARGIEKAWSELQVEFGRTGPGYPGATYYKTISPEGPELFAVVNKKWVLYHDKDKWHRYTTACDLKYGTIRDNNFTYEQVLDKQEDEPWIMVSETDCDTELVDNYM
jgi:hypothetical protein